MDGYFFGDKAKFRWLFVASLLLLFTLLGARELWTLEIRWASIVSEMFHRNDFLHPYLGTKPYYDKPLLSYWLIVLIAKIRGTLTVWELRLPSALSGLLTIWLIYRLGYILKNKSFGLLSGWMLLTTYYFVFWSRISSADMLNVAGSLLAITWYIEKREHAKWLEYVIFFLILALTSLCKGLIAVILPCIAISTDIILQQSWKTHLKPSVLLSMLPALAVYLLPFWASSYFSNAQDQQNGLYFVYRENILRFFKPFDHQGSIYTYLIFLPIYLLPWSFYFIAALLSLKSRLKSMPLYSKWLMWTFFLSFLFFTLSGSRRSYYILPLVPFAILMTADWLMSASSFWIVRKSWLSWVVVSSFSLLFLFIILIPAWYYTEFGSARFAEQLKKEAEKTSPWESWHVVLINAENKLNFYLQLPPTTKDLPLDQVKSLINTKHTIFISRKRNLAQLLPFFSGYKLLKSHPWLVRFPFLRWAKQNMPIAFIPKE